MSDVIHSNYALGFFFFVLAQFIHGLFQSTGGPVNTSIMGNCKKLLRLECGVSHRNASQLNV